MEEMNFFGLQQTYTTEYLILNQNKKILCQKFSKNIPENFLSFFIKYTKYGSTNYITRVNQLKQLVRLNNKNKILFYSLINPFLINQNEKDYQQ